MTHPTEAGATRSCQDGDSCKTWFSCGRGHSFPLVDHSQKDCDLEYFDCINEHYQHECAHDFDSGPTVKWALGETASCACGLTAIAHDMKHGP